MDPVRRPHLAATVLLLALFSFGCSTGTTPPGIGNAEHLEIGYYGFRDQETSFLLVSENDPSYADVATTSRTSDQIDIKRAPESLLRELVDFATSRDFFDYAQERMAPEDLINPATRAIITVRGDGEPFSMALALPMKAAEIQAFTDISIEVTKAFGSLPGLQYVNAGERGANYFTDQQRKLRDSNAGARRSSRP